MADEDTVAVKQMAEWSIVVPADAIESEKYSVEEFQAVFKLATGVSLEKTDSIINIFIVST